MIDRAVETYPEVDEIPERNIELLEHLGVEGWNKLGIATRVSADEWVKQCPMQGQAAGAEGQDTPDEEGRHG